MKKILIIILLISCNTRQIKSFDERIKYYVNDSIIDNTYSFSDFKYDSIILIDTVYGYEKDSLDVKEINNNILYFQNAINDLKDENPNLSEEQIFKIMPKVEEGLIVSKMELNRIIFNPKKSDSVCSVNIKVKCNKKDKSGATLIDTFLLNFNPISNTISNISTK